MVNFPYNVNSPELLNSFFTQIMPECIDILSKKSKPSWGKMSSQHMIEHLLLTFKGSTEKLEFECKVPDEKRVKLQAFLNTNRPIPRGFINPVTGNALLDLKYQDLTQAKEKLKEEIQYYLEYYSNNTDNTQINPLFGELDAEQWEKFHFKHSFHHLSQFNLISASRMKKDRNLCE